jgi:OOP family OmpA-OmpF porin
MRVALVCLVSSLLAASGAAAQESPPLGQFSVLRYSPAPGPHNYFQVDGAGVYGEMEVAAGLQLDYAHEPFRLYDAECDPNGENCVARGDSIRINSYTAAAHIWASLALFHRLQVSLIVPLAITEGDGFQNPNGPGTLLNGGFAFALADPRLHVKGSIFEDRSSGFHLGAAAWITAPLAQSMSNARDVGRFLGDEQPSFGGHVIAELVSSGFHGAVNVGGVWRDGDRLFSTVAGGQLTYGLALGYDVTPLIMLFGELVGATSFSGEVDENPLEGRLGGRIRLGDFQIDLGAGVGILAGVGVPVARALGGFAWAPQRADSDGDGIDDNADSCPTDPEDMDGWHDEDGCPELDNDEDGINDAADTCPDEAEDMDGEDDADGCPDRDDDGDGINDGYDSCPQQPEDMDGDRDDDGCPDADRDRDNIDDTADQCPDQPEDTDGFGDEDGCPETDFDNDGVPDDGDECPDQAEDADGFEDENGCPEEGGPPAAPAGGGRRRR